MSEEKVSFLDKIYANFDYIDNRFGPSKVDHKPACYETREMILECVL